ncbi:YecH family protein [Vibrio sp. Isolate34]|uniref:YecH family metal-binding protein n=1 Tax=Vibrio sp. Isolate34 TaxID=2908540 RepID=UPI001EFDB471|nr:YecH family metal-binding protein [Vibrio sp. Isolate34]MCG9642238.1 YecH family protein [Vibrio sp. Isolate34]
MTTEIHAHNVLNLLSEKPLTREELTLALAQAYGEEARFHTCKLNGLDLDSLLKFFLKMEKVVVVDDKLCTNRERVCNH